MTMRQEKVQLTKEQLLAAICSSLTVLNRVLEQHTGIPLEVLIFASTESHEAVRQAWKADLNMDPDAECDHEGADAALRAAGWYEAPEAPETKQVVAVFTGKPAEA